MPTFELPDTMTSLPTATFEFSPAATLQAEQILAGGPLAAFPAMLRDQESEGSLLVARRVLAAFLPDGGAPADAAPEPDPRAAADAIAAEVAAAREALAERLPALIHGDHEVRDEVLRQRAPLALLAGCWLDTVSQPATQPAVVVNRLLADQLVLRGNGQPRRGLYHLRSRALSEAGVFLPGIEAAGFLRAAHTRPLTAAHALFYLALSRLPASFLPETAGVHYAFHALGTDDLLLGTKPLLGEPALRDTLASYLVAAHANPYGAADVTRLLGAVRLTLALEAEHAGLLCQIADWQRGLSVEAKAAAIIERHAPYAGAQHQGVTVAGQRLTEAFADPDFDLAGFVRTFRRSRQLKPIRGGDGRFLRAIKFGGPMFGIFDDTEAAVFRAWADALATGTLPEEVQVSPNTAGDPRAEELMSAVSAATPADVVYVPASPASDRELFHRLVHIEHFPNTLPLAHRRARDTFAKSEVLFEGGEAGRYTDASFFPYTPTALLDRVDAIYWHKLVNPYRPLTEIPSRDEVVFGQKTFALGSLIDGAWAHRIANLGRCQRASDGMLAAIYADEMGRGDIRKNHITLIHEVLTSMGIDIPHIREQAFLDQDELPDHLYGFSVHQLCMALFPDSFYNEILGYNLGIEMFGLGEMRLHEAQKLRHYGFNPVYEEAHLSIDNVSSGHARQSAEIIISYLDDVARLVGEDAVQAEWRRIWRGYASFAYFIEHALVRELTSGHRSGPAAAAHGELVL